MRVWTNRLLIAFMAPTVVFGSRFARNIILSRSLSQDEFGSSAAISVAIAAVGLVTDVALDRYVMLYEDDISLATAHVVSIIRGSLLAVLFVTAGATFAKLFDIPQFAPSFMIAGAVPLISGFNHFGIKRIQRDFSFLPEAIAQLTSGLIAIIALIVTIPLFRDHRAILVSLILEATSLVIASHVLARIPYQIHCNIATLRTAISFGLPLTLNGLGLAMLSQFDRMLAGTRFGVATLGLYTVILSISVVPASLVLSALSKLAIPYLIRINLANERAAIYRNLITISSIVGNLYALLMALTLDQLITFIYGPSFKISAVTHALMVAIVYIRMQRYGAPQGVLLATSKTLQLAILNTSAGVGLVFAVYLTYISPRFETLLVGILIGEMVSFALFFSASGARVIGEGRSGLANILIGLLVLLTIVGSLGYEPVFSWGARGLIFVVGLSAIGAQVAFELHRNPRLRGMAVGGIRKFRSRF